MKSKFTKCAGFLIFLFSGITVFGQMPYLDTTWIQQSPEFVSPIHHTASVTKAGKLFVTGNYITTGGDTDIITIKYNSNGDTLWMKTQSGSLSGGDDYGVDITTNPTGDVFVLATVENSTTGFDYAVYKYNNTTGALVWSAFWDGETGIDIPASFKVTQGSGAGIYVCGGSEDTLTNMSDFGMIKINTSGSLLWEQFYDYADLHDAATTIKVQGNNVIISGGSAAGIGDWDIASVKLNATSGSVVSSVRTASAVTLTEATSAVSDSTTNEIYVTGFAEASGDRYIQTIKLDTNLNILWVKNYNGDFDDVGKDIALDLDGNVYVTGYTGHEGDLSKAITIKYNPAGDQIWVREFGNIKTELGARSEKIAVSDGGEIFITGTQTNFDNSNVFFFNQYSANGDLLLSAEHEALGVTDSAYDIHVDADTVFITGIAGTPGGDRITAIKYTLLQEVELSHFYIAGQKMLWCQQHRMYSFGTLDSSEIASFVDSVIVIDSEHFYDGVHYVYFSEDATESEVDSIINAIEGEPQFEKEYLVATLTQHNSLPPFPRKLFAGLDKYVCVVFDDPELSDFEIDSFANVYNLELFHWPPDNVSGGVYIFQPSGDYPREEFSHPALTLNVAAAIWEQDSGMVKQVDPSMRVVEPDDPNDGFYEAMWHLENNGDGTCFGGEWYEDADIDADHAWNLGNEFGYGVGYSGAGVTVGVIDFFGYEYDHPDLDSVFEPGWFLPSGGGDVPFTMTTILDTTKAHGMAVSGLIAANLNNYYPVGGVAYESNIVPCLMNVGTTAAMTSGIQVLTDTSQHVSVINMSFGYSMETFAFADEMTVYDAIQNAYYQGRPNPSNPSEKLGIVLVGSSGNQTWFTVDPFQYNLPASYLEVLSVGATTPQDMRKAFNDDFEHLDGTGSWGSFYSNSLDVCAPGVCMLTTDFQGAPGYNPDEDYCSFIGTSAAAPLASGVAALVLDKNPELTVEEVYDALRFSAEKVGGYSYSPSGPTGKTLELGYGRLSAFHAVANAGPVSVDEDGKPIMQFYFNNPADAILMLTVLGCSSYSIKIVSITGGICYEEDVIDRSYGEIDVSNLEGGLYFINITDRETKISNTAKLVVR